MKSGLRPAFPLHNGLRKGGPKPRVRDAARGLQDA